MPNGFLRSCSGPRPKPGSSRRGAGESGGASQLPQPAKCPCSSYQEEMSRHEPVAKSFSMLYSTHSLYASLSLGDVFSAETGKKNLQAPSAASPAQRRAARRAWLGSQRRSEGEESALLKCFALFAYVCMLPCSARACGNEGAADAEAHAAQPRSDQSAAITSVVQLVSSVSP